jgi:peptidoglycan/xylan/chitin deacetylase (PgdA/CDA1 family)
MTPVMKFLLVHHRIKSLYNQDVIYTLEKEKVPATLFLTGMWVEEYSTTTKELSENPLFEIANHSYTHGAFSGRCFGLKPISKDKDKQEVLKTDALLSKYTDNHYQKYFRFPGLCSSKESREAVESTGYTIIDGDVTSGDGFQRNSNKIIRNVVDHVKPGSIVIMHMHGSIFAPKTGEALPKIISTLREKGYTFVKVSELIKE